MSESLSKPASPLRGGLIGYGHIASQGHLPAYRQLTDGASQARKVNPIEITVIADICSHV